MNIQLQANRMVDGCVEPATVDEAEFFSLYEGQPGGYVWLADCATLEFAQIAGKAFAEAGDWDYVENLI